MATTPRGIVTPEAVVLDLETAGIASRGLARSLDAAIQGVLLLVLLLAIGGLTNLSGSLAVVAVVVSVAGVVLAYPIICEIAMRGRSPGKAAFGLRVVTVDGAPEAPRHAFIRSALGLVDFLVPPGGLFAVLVALPSPRNQRLGDMVAGTMVLRERTAAPPPTAVWFNPPPGLEAYAASIDVSRIDDDQISVARSFLLRALQLAPEARHALALRIGTPLTALVGNPPPGVPPEPFLICVVAAHQRRHQPPRPSYGSPAPAGVGAPATAASWSSPPPPADRRPPTPPPVASPPPPPPPPPVGGPR